jgi:protein ImuB
MSRAIAIVFPEWGQHYASFGEEHSFIEFERVVRAVTAISPLVEVEDAGVMVLSARGPSRYFGGEESVVQHLRNICSVESIASGIGIASSRFAALVAAHLSASRGTPCIIHQSVAQDFLNGIPVSALHRIGAISADTVGLLQRLGLSHCHAVRDIGESALIDRFGAEGRSVWQLVTGEDVRHFSPDAPPSDFARTIDFESPLITAPHVVAASHNAVNDAMQTIANQGQRCVRLLVECETDHAETSTRVWGELRGFSAAAVLQRLMYQLDGWLMNEESVPDAPTSGIVRVRLVPLDCCASTAVQPLLWGGYEENIERAIRAVTMACAVDASVTATVPQWEGGRDIAQVYSYVPFSTVNIADTHDAEQRVTTGRGVARHWSGAVPTPSPACVFPQPHHAVVVNNSGEPVLVSGRHELTSVPARIEVEGYSYRVESVAGPWPVEERWWDARRRRRHVRMQMLVRNQRNAARVLLLGLENSEWTVLARYD